MKEIENFSDIIQTIKNLPSSSLSQKNKARDYQLTLTKPPGSLGLLEELAIDLCGWQNKLFPELKNVKTLIFAGNHGVCDQSVNAFPQSVTQQMVSNFQNGGAAINQLCKVAGSDLQVIPIDLENPTKDITKDSAMKETEFLACINIGINSIDKNSNIIILGEMGIGNSTIAAAINYACFGGSIIDWVGMGTSTSNSILEHKVSVIEKATSINRSQNPIEILMNLGGKEQAAIFGAVMACRVMKIPVIIDGYICSSSIAPLYLLNDIAIENCIFSHYSREKGHKKLLSIMGKKAILDLDLCLGEGTGAVLALNIIRSSIACHNGMASFTEAGVSNKI